jgi:hypothetical protein
VVNAPYTVIVETSRDAHRYSLDGRPWPCADKGEVWVPPGEHILGFGGGRRSWLDTSEMETRLLSLSGELLGARPRGRGLEVEYSSLARCALMFNKRPWKLSLDGKSVTLPVLKGDDGFTVLAPPGQHQLEVVSESPLLYLIKFTGLVLASLIVLFGIASSGFLAILFLLIMLKRRAQSIRRFFAPRKKG